MSAMEKSYMIPYVVEQTGKTISASSNRLTRLRELGVLACVTNEAVETGGRQNVYEPVG